MPAGRPTDYTVALGEQICEELIEGDSLIKITSAPDMPTYRSVMRWVIKHDEFCQSYTRARERQADAVVDKGLHEVDTATEKDDVISATRKAETRLKLAEKMYPKKYGNKLELSGGLELKMTDEQIGSRIAHLLRKDGAAEASGGEVQEDEAS